MDNLIKVGAAIKADANAEKVWEEVKKILKDVGTLRLHRSNSHYTIEFEGDAMEAIKMIELIEREPDHEIVAHYCSYSPIDPRY